MIATRPASSLPSRISRPAIVAAVGAAAVAGLVAGEGNPAWGLAPIGLVAFGWALTKIPARLSATGLAFLLLALDLETDAEGLWSSPFVSLGELLYFGLGRILPINAAGFEILIPLVAATSIGRLQARSDPTHLAAPRVTRDALVVCCAGVALALVIGLANGWGAVPWKIRYLLHGPLFFVLFQTAYRDPADFRLLGKAIIAAAHVKALFAAWVQLVVAPELTGGRLATATNHGDSVLFALSILVTVIPVLENPTRRKVARACALVSLPIWGIVLNDRRLAWGMLAMSLAAVFAISPWRPWKRKLVRACILGAPILAGYVWIGWNVVSTGPFAPIAKLKSMVDSKNPSTYWRDVETWNIAATIRDTPLVGIGLGGEYEERMFNDDISGIYPDYRGWPHNTVLGLLLLMGVFGFSAAWLPYLLVVYLAVRSYARSETVHERASALLCVCAIVCCSAMAWGDTGAHFLQYNLSFGASLALAGKLAMSTGALAARDPGRSSYHRPRPSG